MVPVTRIRLSHRQHVIITAGIKSCKDQLRVRDTPLLDGGAGTSNICPLVKCTPLAPPDGITNCGCWSKSYSHPLNYGTPNRVSSCLLPPLGLRHRHPCRLLSVIQRLAAIGLHAEQSLQHPALRDHARAVVDAARDRSRLRLPGETALRRALRTRGLGIPVAFATPFYFDLLSNIPWCPES